VYSKFLFLLFIISFYPAYASPWTRDQGELYLRFSLAGETSSRTEQSVLRSDLYAEYGLTDVWTFSLKSEQLIENPPSLQHSASGWRVGARRNLVQSGAFVLSSEVSMLAGEAILGMRPCKSAAYEVKGSGGWSGQIWNKSLYFYTDISGQYQGSCQKQFMELGLGFDLADRVRGVAQFWHEQGSTEPDLDKIQLELIWQGDCLNYSLGVRAERSEFFVRQGAFIALSNKW